MSLDSRTRLPKLETHSIAYQLGKSYPLVASVSPTIIEWG